MSRMVKAGKLDGYVRQKADELTRYLPQKDWRGQVYALTEFVRDRIRYQRDTRGIERIADARTTLLVGQGDCDDKSILLAALLESIGHPTRFAAVGFKPGDFSHVFVQSLIGPRWLSLETTEPRPIGWKPKGIRSFMIQNN